MASLWCTGPALYYAAIAGGKAAFLGTTEGKPTIEIRHEWEGVRNDIGASVPMDDSFQGSTGFLSIPLTRWNEPVLTAIRSVPNPAGVPGVNPFGTIGALALTEGFYLRFWIVFPYVRVPAFAAMVPGYHFPACRLDTETHQGGTSARKESLMVIARRAFDPKSYTFTLYNTNVTGLPNPD